MFINIRINYLKGAHGILVGWGTLLQAGMLQVWFQIRSLDFSFDPILTAALWPWGWLSLTEMCTRNFPGGVKGGQVHKALNLTANLWAHCLENEEALTSHRDSFTFYTYQLPESSWG
jgi:hypothetical protein